MRLRNLPGADDILKKSPFIVKSFDKKSDSWNNIFKNDNPIFIEIGCGKGNFIIENAIVNPEINFIGIERYSTVVAKAAQKAETHEKANKLMNLKFIRFDANYICSLFDENEVEKIFINFSDPWPKNKHSKRRLTSSSFLDKYRRILSLSGTIEQKTDNVDLFNFSMSSVKQNNWNIIKFSYDYHNEKYCKDNIMTEYEKKFTNIGIPICFMSFSR